MRDFKCFFSFSLSVIISILITFYIKMTCNFKNMPVLKYALPTSTSKFRNRGRRSLHKGPTAAPQFQGVGKCGYSALHSSGKQNSAITGAVSQGHSKLPRQNSRNSMLPEFLSAIECSSEFYLPQKIVVTLNDSIHI